jgi:hypothetical protein
LKEKNNTIHDRKNLRLREKIHGSRGRPQTGLGQILLEKLRRTAEDFTRETRE